MNKPLLFDGAFGTYYNNKTLNNQNPEFANINDKEAVFNIHKEYILSGANAIKTNTFGANLTISTDYTVIKAIIENGYNIAFRATSGTEVLVFADIGQINSENAVVEYKEIVDSFINLGATNFLFETLLEIETLKPIIGYIKRTVSKSVIITSFAVSQDGYTKSGEYYKDLFELATNAGVDYVGLNCICGPAHMLNLLGKVNTQKYNLSIMPNSGYPTFVNGRTVYIDNPEYFSDKLYDIYCSGAKIIGGCCGTTPEHIKAIANRINSDANSHIYNIENTSQRIKPSKSTIFDLDKKIIAVEIDSPIDTGVSYLLNASKKAKQCGADLITIADSPLARTRADSIMIASKIQREIGIETIPHLSCRDKNLIAIKGILIAGNIEGVKNILAITGDPIALADRIDLKNVFSFNSFKLINFINKLNDDIFFALPYNICGALNINSINFENELNRAKEKIINGAICLFTQPIYSKRNADNLLLAKKSLSCKILAGIMPIASYKNALFLNNEVAGIEIPKAIIDRLKDKSCDEVKQISIDYCKEIINNIKDNCDGFYIVTPLKKIDFVEELIKYIRSL